MSESESERIHVYPLSEPEHEAAVSCWCDPALEFKNQESGAEIWLHKVVQ